MINCCLGFYTLDEVECCAHELFEVSSQICCGDVIVDNDYGEDGACCHDTAINSTNTICCRDTAHSIDEIEAATCCGKITS